MNRIHVVVNLVSVDQDSITRQDKTRMNDFPKGGDVSATRAWLDKKGFGGLFVH